VNEPVVVQQSGESERPPPFDHRTDTLLHLLESKLVKVMASAVHCSSHPDNIVLVPARCSSLPETGQDTVDDVHIAVDEALHSHHSLDW
jgi:hypothetical protein